MIPDDLAMKGARESAAMILRWYEIPSYQYRKSHYGDKMFLQPSYLHGGISYTGKTISLY